MMKRLSRWLHRYRFRRRDRLARFERASDVVLFSFLISYNSYFDMQLVAARYLLIASGAALATIVTSLSQGWKEEEFRNSLLLGAPLFSGAFIMSVVSIVTFITSKKLIAKLNFQSKSSGYVYRLKSKIRLIVVFDIIGILTGLCGMAFLLFGINLILRKLLIHSGLKPDDVPFFRY